jgi:hypothetical protein
LSSLIRRPLGRDQRTYYHNLALRSPRQHRLRDRRVRGLSRLNPPLMIFEAPTTARNADNPTPSAFSAVVTFTRSACRRYHSRIPHGGWLLDHQIRARPHNCVETIGRIAASSRRKLSGLTKKLKRLSDDLEGPRYAEERRLLTELKVAKKSDHSVQQWASRSRSSLILVILARCKAWRCIDGGATARDDA